MKTYLEKLEDELKKVWKEYGSCGPIKGAHTEIEVEPKVFLGDAINPEIADILASIYLSKTTIEDLHNGNLELHDEAIVIKDKNKKPIAIIRSQMILREFKSRFGL